MNFDLNSFQLDYLIRCDIIKDCLDKSDERDCPTLGLVDYIKTDPPIKDRNENGTSVNVTIVITTIGNFVEMDMTFRAKISLRLSWFDWRVNFYNLKFSNENFNYFANSDLKDAWLPRLIFGNSMNADSLKFDDLSSVIVQRKGPRTLNSFTELQENEIFDGEDNPFVYNRTYDLNLSCIFKLENYPFDYQNCFIEVFCFYSWVKLL